MFQEADAIPHSLGRPVPGFDAHGRDHEAALCARRSQVVILAPETLTTSLGSFAANMTRSSCASELMAKTLIPWGVGHPRKENLGQGGFCS